MLLINMKKTWRWRQKEIRKTHAMQSQRIWMFETRKMRWKKAANENSSHHFIGGQDWRLMGWGHAWPWNCSLAIEKVSMHEWNKQHTHLGKTQTRYIHSHTIDYRCLRSCCSIQKGTWQPWHKRLWMLRAAPRMGRKETHCTGRWQRETPCLTESHAESLTLTTQVFTPPHTHHSHAHWLLISPFHIEKKRRRSPHWRHGSCAASCE